MKHIKKFKSVNEKTDNWKDFESKQNGLNESSSNDEELYPISWEESAIAFRQRLKKKFPISEFEKFDYNNLSYGDFLAKRIRPNFLYCLAGQSNRKDVIDLLMSKNVDINLPDFNKWIKSTTYLSDKEKEEILDYVNKKFNN